MAGTVTVLEEHSDVSPRITKITWIWVADGAGVVTTPDSLTTTIFNGTVMNLCTRPHPGNPPLNLYDITILDDNGYDVMVGAGLNRSNAVDEQTAGFTAGTMPRAIKNTHLELVIAAAGADNEGVTILYISE